MRNLEINSVQNKKISSNVSIKPTPVRKSKSSLWPKLHRLLLHRLNYYFIIFRSCWPVCLWWWRPGLPVAPTRWRSGLLLGFLQEKEKPSAKQNKNLRWDQKHLRETAVKFLSLRNFCRFEVGILAPQTKGLNLSF